MWKWGQSPISHLWKRGLSLFPQFFIFAENDSINYGTDQNRQGSIERDHKKRYP